MINDWLKVSILLSIFGFFKEFRPSEPFIFEFLTDKRWRNITEVQVNQDVYPVGTYSSLGFLVFVFLITDLCKYKPLIVLLGVSGIVIWSLLLWTTSLLELQIVELFYGLFNAAEVAYFSYIYTKVEKEHYQKVSSHTRAATLAGRAISGGLAQILVSFNVLDYRQLNFITLSALIVGTTWSLFLPSVERSIYFHRDKIQQQTFKSRVTSAFILLKNHACDSYTNLYVLKWSLWFALATCGFVQVQTYIQPLWKVINDGNNEDQMPFNGAVEALLTILGFLGSLFAGVSKIDWEVQGELTLTVCSLLQGFIILGAATTSYVIVSYICYVAFGTLFYFMITVTYSEIAKKIKDDCFGLVFGINTFLGLAFQSLLTTFIVGNTVGLGLSPRNQYLAYGYFHLIEGSIFIVIGLITWSKSKMYLKSKELKTQIVR